MIWMLGSRRLRRRTRCQKTLIRVEKGRNDHLRHPRNLGQKGPNRHTRVALPTTLKAPHRIHLASQGKATTPKMGHKEGFSGIKVIPNSFYLMDPPNFIAGNVTNFLPNWVAITEDLHLLQLIAEGVTLDFHTPPPTQHRYSTWSHPHSPGQEKILSLEIQRLQKKGVVVPTQLKPCSFISPIFTTDTPCD